MHAYSELYLDDARNSLGEAFDYSVYCCSLSPEQFFDRFLATPWATRFETGVPGAVSGKSGTELAMEVIRETGGLPCGGSFSPPQDTIKPSEEFWAGWVLAYAQWRDRLRFRDILTAVPVNRIVAMYYPYHEASEDKFADYVLEKLRSLPPISCLAKIRRLAGLSQAELSARSGVNIRNIQQYEQGVNDINKAGYAQISALSSVLGCKPESLVVKVR